MRAEVKLAEQKAERTMLAKLERVTEGMNVLARGEEEHFWHSWKGSRKVRAMQVKAVTPTAPKSCEACKLSLTFPLHFPLKYDTILSKMEKIANIGGCKMQRVKKMVAIMALLLVLLPILCLAQLPSGDGWIHFGGESSPAILISIESK